LGRRPSGQLGAGRRRCDNWRAMTDAVSSNSRLSPKVFLSYRRADTADVAGRIRDYLINRGEFTDVFMDVESIALGRDFRVAVASAIDVSDAVLVVMCPAWLGITNEQGQRRLDLDEDPVRIEIEMALSRRKRLIPLLAGGARMPAEKDLPEVIRSFAFLNGKQIRPDPDFRNDMEVLMRAILSGNQTG
jgi:TIR domain